MIVKNKAITAILNEVATESTFNLKICLIEDICKAKRLLWAMGDTQHDEFIKPEDSARLFDELYELDVKALEIVNNGYGKRINELMIKRMEAVA
jgi:hypothetical protein